MAEYFLFEGGGIRRGRSLGGVDVHVHTILKNDVRFTDGYGRFINSS